MLVLTFFFILARRTPGEARRASEADRRTSEVAERTAEGARRQFRWQMGGLEKQIGCRKVGG